MMITRTRSENRSIGKETKAGKSNFESRKADSYLEASL